MPRTPPPLLGFNNNVRHQGRIFHIQTEDSGVKNPRLVTHLFADGGRILKTTRTDYTEHVGREDMAVVVRRLMKEQHKGMFIALRSGEYDVIIEEACGPSPAALAPDAPDSLRMPESLPVPAAADQAEEAPVNLKKPSRPPKRVSRPPKKPSKPPRKKRGRQLSNPNLRRVTPSVPPPAVDFDLDMASMDANPPKRSRPPPPSDGGPPPPRKGTPVHGTPPVATGPGKYAPSRPAAIFNEPKSPEKQSIFGESVISEKSLDEVILSYLAEDLEGPPD